MRKPVRNSWCIALLLYAFSSIGSDAGNIVFGTLNASLNDGSLAGTTFQIVFSYDADQVADTGDSYVQLKLLRLHAARSPLHPE